MITLEHSDDVALLVMDDGKANVVNPAFIGAFADALDQAESSAKALVIAGRPTVFSGGFDLKILAGENPTASAELLKAGGDLALRLLHLPIPTVTVTTGHAIAMGLLLYLAGDVRVIEPGDQRLQMNETLNGMVLPSFAVEILRARLAPADLFPIAVQAEPLDPSGALARGVATRMTEPGGAYEAALSVATSLAGLPTDTYASQKKLLLKTILTS